MRNTKRTLFAGLLAFVMVFAMVAPMQAIGSNPVIGHTTFVANILAEQDDLFANDVESFITIIEHTPINMPLDAGFMFNFSRLDLELSELEYLLELENLEVRATSGWVTRSIFNIPFLSAHQQSAIPDVVSLAWQQWQPYNRTTNDRVYSGILTTSNVTEIRHFNSQTGAWLRSDFIIDLSGQVQWWLRDTVMRNNE